MMPARLFSDNHQNISISRNAIEWDNLTGEGTKSSDMIFITKNKSVFWLEEIDLSNLEWRHLDSKNVSLLKSALGLRHHKKQWGSNGNKSSINLNKRCKTRTRLFFSWFTGGRQRLINLIEDRFQLCKRLNYKKKINKEN